MAEENTKRNVSASSLTRGKNSLSKHTQRIASRGIQYYTDPEIALNSRVLRLWKSYQGWTGDQPEIPGMGYDRDVLVEAVIALHDEDKRLQVLSRNSIVSMMIMNQSLRAVPFHCFFLMAKPKYNKENKRNI